MAMTSQSVITTNFPRFDEEKSVILWSREVNISILLLYQKEQ